MEKQILARLAQFGSDSPALPEILGILLPTAQRATLTARAEAARLKLATGRPWLAANTPGGDVVWPEDATHMLRRKGCASFIRYSPERQRVDLLRGSVMLAATRSSFPRYHKALRNDALMQGYFVQDGDLIRVIHACPLDTPSTAATLVSGTVDNGWTSWRDREGKPIPRAPGRQTPRLTREVQIEDETADAERPAAAERRSNR